MSQKVEAAGLTARKQNETECEPYDLLVIGTGIGVALIAAAAAREGKKVLHVDSGFSYGGINAVHKVRSLRDVPELVKRSAPNAFVEFEFFRNDDLNAQGTVQGSLLVHLCPRLYYSSGSTLEFLARTRVGRSLDFHAVDSVHVAPVGETETENGLACVPMSKQAVFADASLDLLSKRLVMRELGRLSNEINGADNVDSSEQVTMGDTARPLGPKLARLVTHGLAFCNSATLASTGQRRIQRALSSIGVFSKSPFLHGLHGSGSELSQALCRCCAVYGGTYMLGVQRAICSVPDSGANKNTPNVTLEILHDSDEKTTLHTVFAKKVYVCSATLHYDTAKQSASEPIVLLDSSLSSFTEKADVWQRAVFVTTFNLLDLVVQKKEQSCPETTCVLFADPDASGSEIVFIMQEGWRTGMSPAGVFLVHAVGASRESIDRALFTSAGVPRDAVLETLWYRASSTCANVLRGKAPPKCVWPCKETKSDASEETEVSLCVDFDAEFEAASNAYAQDTKTAFAFDPLPDCDLTTN